MLEAWEQSLGTYGAAEPSQIEKQVTIKEGLSLLHERTIRFQRKSRTGVGAIAVSVCRAA